MGIFQLFFSAGIYFGDSGYKLIYKSFPNGLLSFSVHKTIFVITTIIAIVSIIIALMVIIRKKNL